MPNSPALTDSLFSTVYSTFDHNNLVIAYVLAALFSAYLLFRHPNRFHSLLLFGFSILTLNFEYEKHIIAPLREQTLMALAPDPNVHLKLQQYTDLILSVLIPISLFIIGWVLIFWAMYTGGKNGKKNSTL